MAVQKKICPLIFFQNEIFVGRVSTKKIRLFNEAKFRRKGSCPFPSPFSFATTPQIRFVLLETLTAENHHEDDENLFGLRKCRDIAKADTRHTGQREVEGSHVGHGA